MPSEISSNTAMFIIFLTNILALRMLVYLLNYLEKRKWFGTKSFICVLYIGVFVINFLLIILSMYLLSITDFSVPTSESENSLPDQDLTSMLFKNESENIEFNTKFKDEFFEDNSKDYNEYKNIIII